MTFPSCGGGTGASGVTEPRGLTEAAPFFIIPFPITGIRRQSTTDAYLPENGEVTNISARLDGPGLTFGSEEQAMAMACRNGVFSSFAEFVPGRSTGEDSHETDHICEI